MDGVNTHSVCEHLFRRQAGRIVSCLAGALGSCHLQLAEDAVQESLLRAVQAWPFSGVPAHPEGWLFRVAHNYAISRLRRGRNFESSADGMQDPTQVAGELDTEWQLRDDEVRMIFMCCHPDLPQDARLALSLKLVGGFSVGEIARLFLAEEAAIAQRLVRAKRLIREHKLPLSMPAPAALSERLDSVLDVIYLMFSGGYAPRSGEDLIRQDVCFEAIRLGELIAASSISVPRADALVALMALQAARTPARLSEVGEMVLLEEQDRTLWDRSLIELGFRYFERSIVGHELSTWHVQAAIAAAYARAESSAAIDWTSMLNNYDDLVTMTGSPVVALNRAVVVCKVHGAAAAMAAIKRLEHEPTLRNYHLLWAVRGRFLTELGRLAEAELAFSTALECDCSEPEKRFLQRQWAAVRSARANMTF